jgi:hypothetical protein
LRRTLVRYGTHRANVAELWRPPLVTGDLPVVVLIHGGYWKAAYTKRLMRRLSNAVTRAGPRSTPNTDVSVASEAVVGGRRRSWTWLRPSTP